MVSETACQRVRAGGLCPNSGKAGEIQEWLSEIKCERHKIGASWKNQNGGPTGGQSEENGAGQ